MNISSLVYTFSKKGNDPEDNQDSYYLPTIPNLNTVGNYFRFAIADGATSSSFPDIWGKLLVNSFGEYNLEESLDKINHSEIEILTQKWISLVENRLLIAEEEKNMWYAREKSKSGSASTFLGLKLWGMGNCNYLYNYRVLAIGDSCFFHIVENKYKISFPIKNHHDFNNFPPLITTDPYTNSSIEFNSFKNSCNEGDIFYLMTDAIASWFMCKCEKNKDFPKIFDKYLESETIIGNYIDDLRNSKQLENDDTTIMRIEIL